MNIDPYTLRFDCLNWELSAYFIKKYLGFCEECCAECSGLGHTVMFQMKPYYSLVKGKYKMTIFEKVTHT